jgi:hypothetical protein
MSIIKQMKKRKDSDESLVEPISILILRLTGMMEIPLYSSLKLISTRSHISIIGERGTVLPVLSWRQVFCSTQLEYKSMRNHPSTLGRVILVVLAFLLCTGFTSLKHSGQVTHSHEGVHILSLNLNNINALQMKL